MFDTEPLTREGVEKAFAKGEEIHYIYVEDRQDNTPECAESCELKDIILETPDKEFNVSIKEEYGLVEEFLRNSIGKLESIELKEQIEALEKEKKILEQKIDALYMKILGSALDGDIFNSEEILKKLRSILSNNSIEDIQQWLQVKKTTT